MLTSALKIFIGEGT